MFMKSRQLKKMARTMSQPSTQTNDSGLTLIEGLVAIVIIAITTTVMTPMVILAVGARVQSQRTEQAFQIAQAEVDRIKVIVERGGAYTLNIAPTPAAVVSTADFETQVPGSDPPEYIMPPPATIADDYSTTSDSARGIDFDNDGNDDYAVQIFRTAGVERSGRPVAFDLGVRVYRANALAPGANLGVEQARLSVSNSEGQAGSRPLANIYTSIIRSDGEESLCDYYEFIDNTASVPADC
ncbi:hypothetical protein DXZ20_12250 [Leptolyngbyaceae cyanobacterium CCMR0081]|uniref:Type II secretion system protein n=2 Tax=Adonisia TaxID=2950183 RepID=A0A6M0RKM2_9CYAN|nr:hypothetical protein [Adonisia turfae CCMR0081]